MDEAGADAGIRIQDRKWGWFDVVRGAI